MVSHRSDPPAPEVQGGVQHLTVGGTSYETTLTKKFLKRKPWVAPDPRRITCMIPGMILNVYARAGHRVHRSESLFLLEAMKMQNEVLSPIDGTVMAIHIKVGQQVAKGELLMELE